MDFPRRDTSEASPPEGLLEAIKARALGVFRTANDYLVVLASEREVRAVEPDHRALRGVGVRGVMVTAPAADPEFDFVSRYFAPGSGIDEDPATGSAHCALAPFWGPRLGKRRMRAYQASARGAVIEVELQDERVALAGKAVTVLEGQLQISPVSWC